MVKRLFLWLTVITSLLNGQEKKVDLKPFFKGIKGTIVIYNSASKEYLCFDVSRSRQRFAPASTFKILNSLISLETGVVPDENYIIKWDGIEREVKDWNRDHTMASAMKYSVVPYYQELARRAGKEMLQKYLIKSKYGNMTIGEKVDFFWLDSSLKISAEEQIRFLDKFYNYKLPFSAKSVDIVKKIIPEEIYPKSKIKFKTGTAEIGKDKFVGWLVGYVEKVNNVFFFAFNVEETSYLKAKKLRDEIPINILKHLAILE